jgi:hypothetical protein
VVGSNADVPPPLVSQVIVTAFCNAYQVITHGANLVAIAGAEVNGAAYSSPPPTLHGTGVMRRRSGEFTQLRKYGWRGTRGLTPSVFGVS